MMVAGFAATGPMSLETADGHESRKNGANRGGL